MRKIIAFLLAVMLIASIAVTASACTPKLNISKVPQISSIQFKLNEALENAVEMHTADWVNKWVTSIDFSKIKFN